MTRVVTSPKGFTFKNGMHLPQGTRVNGIPSGAISMDPKIWDNPEEFDGYRFLKLRQAERDTNKHAFTSHTLFLFGAGKHVCPGRFLAEAEIKIVTAIFLLNFDIRAKDVRTRISVEGFKIPDVTTRIDFRRRIQ